MGFFVQSLGGDGTAMVSMQLYASSFLSFHCEQPVSVKVGMAFVADALAVCQPSGSITIVCPDGSGLLEVRADWRDARRVASTSIFVQILAPALHPAATMCMSAREFKKLCGEISVFQSHVRIHAHNDCIEFSGSGCAGAASMVRGGRGVETADDGVVVRVLAPSVATFPLPYLLLLSHALPDTGALELGVGPNIPLYVKVDHECGFLRFYAGPMIDE